jgi:hypothetical protein
MHVARRPSSLTSSSCPLSQSRSFSNEGSARDVVVERRWSWSSVTDSDEFVGRISLVSRLPQYLRHGERTADETAGEHHGLDARDVHGGRRGCLVDGHRGASTEERCQREWRRERTDWTSISFMMNRGHGGSAWHDPRVPHEATSGITRVGSFVFKARHIKGCMYIQGIARQVSTWVSKTRHASNFHALSLMSFSRSSKNLPSSHQHVLCSTTKETQLTLFVLL